MPGAGDFDTGDAILAEHAVAILGPARGGEHAHHGHDAQRSGDRRQLIRDLLERGMDIMRVNCAHDDAQVWAQMVRNLRLAEETGRRMHGVLRPRRPEAAHRTDRSGGDDRQVAAAAGSRSAG